MYHIQYTIGEKSTFKPTSRGKNARFVKDVATRSTWGAQIGLRFIF
jgi:hypothetical protein